MAASRKYVQQRGAYGTTLSRYTTPCSEACVKPRRDRVEGDSSGRKEGSPV